MTQKEIDKLTEFEEGNKPDPQTWWNFIPVLREFCLGIILGYLFREELMEALIWIVNLF